MRVQPPPSAAGAGAGGHQDAESLFRTKPIAEIRNVEAATRRQIEDKKEELRQLVGNRYRDLIDSADSIVLMKSSCEAISRNVSSVQSSILSLSDASPRSPTSPGRRRPRHHPARFDVYGIACRVKYLVDTPENIWGCLDESMFLEAAARYLRAKHVQHGLARDGEGGGDPKILANFPLLQHQWQIVESFKAQISQRSRERLLDGGGLKIGAYADALAAVAVIDDLEPRQVLGLFLDSRKSWVLQKLATSFVNPACSDVVTMFCEVLRAIQVTMGQVGELFLQVLNDMPLFYKVTLSSPPASQLFGGIPNPDEEVRLWKSFRDRLESAMTLLEKPYIASTCLNWLKECGREIVSKMSGRYLTDAISTGEEIALAEKLIRETMDSKEVLEGSLDWLKSVFGSEIELPWSRIRELVLEADLDLWDEIFEDAFVQRMRSIIDSGFGNLTRDVNIGESIRAIEGMPGEKIDFRAYLSRPSTGGGVWFIEPNDRKTVNLPSSKAQAEESSFQTCLSAYFGPEVYRIRDAVDNYCQRVLEDLLHFLESPKAAIRLKTLAKYLQDRCYEYLSSILMQLKGEVDSLCTALENEKRESHTPSAAIIVEKSLFIGRLLFALQNHCRHIPRILGSPRFWVNESISAVFDRLPGLLGQSRGVTDSPVSDSPIRQSHMGSRRHTSLATAAILGADDIPSPKFKDFSVTTRDLCVRAHSLWITWLSMELSTILSRDLEQDDGLSSITPLRGWEDTVIKQEQSDDGQSELRMSLPFMPSLYVISFLFRACEEIHRIGGHVLDKLILQKFALQLLEKVTDIYGNYLSTEEANGSKVSDKGALQVMLDLKFVYDILSGGDSTMDEELSRSSKPKYSFRQKDQRQKKSAIRTRIDGLVHRLSQRLDPIDWLTFEPYLWENERQSYLRHAVLFGFFVQLNRLYVDTVQKLPTNSESNIMRCSTVPRFKYLPISVPALSSRRTSKATTGVSMDGFSSRSPKSYSNGEISRTIDLDDRSSSGVAAPLLKSFMQVGSRFGESTLKLGSILTDGQVGIFKDRSAAALSTFSDVLPVQAAGLLSSFTTTRPDA
ncbi:hypothetical protein EUGRSUZ_G00871 [Eucalyptus grandis]|uniref:Conserved oligomeric Golgi complex subunit 1 n=2 Tax=Eucalyptus grandis TaxID=71139 RepID=A0A059BAI9_EUCGR|nr:hypothetical protein EUGRSUZ_G00871 [Eucalyptus grandis]